MKKYVQTKQGHFAIELDKEEMDRAKRVKLFYSIAFPVVIITIMVLLIVWCG
jgi:hypothetical protein